MEVPYNIWVIKCDVEKNGTILSLKWNIHQKKRVSVLEISDRTDINRSSTSLSVSLWSGEVGEALREGVLNDHAFT